MKKNLAIIIAAALMLSLVFVGAIGAFAADPDGSAENPYTLILDENGDAEIAAIPAGASAYYTALSFAVEGKGLTLSTAMDVTIKEYDYSDVEVKSTTYENTTSVPEAFMNVDFFTSNVVIIFTNSTAADIAAFNVNITAPIGSYENPELIALDTEVPVKLDATNDQGYYFKYVTTESGTLVASVTDGKMNLECSSSRLYDVTTGSVRAGAGETVLIQIVNANDDDFNTDGVDGTLTINFVAADGSAENPFMLAFNADGEATVAAIPAGASVHYVANAFALSGKELAISTPIDLTIKTLDFDGNEIGSKTYNNVTSVPDAFTSLDFTVGSVALVFTNSTEAEIAQFTASLKSPLGSWDNPHKLELDTETEVFLDPSNWDGYNFEYTATDFGNITATVTDGYVVLTNTNSYEMTDSERTSGTVKVAPGDIVSIQVVNKVDENFVGLGVDGTITLSFTAPDALELDESGNLALPTLSYYGTAVYIADGMTPTNIYSIAGQIVNVNNPSVTVALYAKDWSGVYTQIDDLTSIGRFTQAVVIIFTNEDLDFAEVDGAVATFSYPLGSYNNPEDLLLDTEAPVVVDSANQEGYYFEYTATDYGTITATVTDGYVVLTNNSTFETTDSELTSATVTVAPGDVISILVINEVDENFVGLGVEGTVKISFTAPDGLALDSEGKLTVENLGYYKKLMYIADASSATTLYEIIGRIASVDNAGLKLEMYAKDFMGGYTPIEDLTSINGRMTAAVVFILTNETEDYSAIEKATLKLSYPLGSELNPEVIDSELGTEIPFTIPENSGEYKFVWTASGDGTLKVAPSEGIGASIGTEGDLEIGATEFDVKEGDEIVIYVYSDDFVTFDGTITLSLEVESAETGDNAWIYAGIAFAAVLGGAVVFTKKRSF